MLDNPLISAEERLGAEFATVEGWRLPSGFGEPAAEHRAMRESAGIVDRTGVGRIKITGKDRLDLLQRLCTQHLKEGLGAGRGVPAVFTTNKGRIVDLAHLYDCGDWHLLLASPQRRTILPEWIRRYVLGDQVALTDIGSEGGAFRITGPKTAEILKALGGIPPGAIEPHRILGLALGGLETMVIGESAGPRPACLIIAEKRGVAQLYEEAVAAARALGGGPAGEAAREILRVEDGLPEAGSELTEEANPWEARLDFAIHLNKGCYIGQEVIARLNTYDKVSRRLAGFRLGQAAPPPPRSKVYTGGVEAGVITSSVRSLSLGETIALGYLRIDALEAGTEVTIASGPQGVGVRAKVVAVPIVA